MARFIEYPLISIITATFNAEDHLEKTIISIKNQTFKNYEYIIVDGASSDSTPKIIEQYSDDIDYFLSEPDKGIYDAWNKGLSFSKGKWVCFLGAGDEFLPDALEQYAMHINSADECNLDIVSSAVQFVDADGNCLYQKGASWNWKAFRTYMNICHTGAMHSKNLFEQFGLYNIDYKIAGDYELLLRPREKLKADFFDKITVRMLEGGISQTGKVDREHYLAKVNTGGVNRFVAFAEYLISRIKSKVRIFLYERRIFLVLKK